MCQIKLNLTGQMPKLAEKCLAVIISTEISVASMWLLKIKQRDTIAVHFSLWKPLVNILIVVGMINSPSLKGYPVLTSKGRSTLSHYSSIV